MFQEPIFKYFLLFQFYFFSAMNSNLH